MIVSVSYLCRKRKAFAYIEKAGKTIAPVVAASAEAGYDWVMEVIKANGLDDIWFEFHVAKALHFLKMRQYDKVSFLAMMIKLSTHLTQSRSKSSNPSPTKTSKCWVPLRQIWHSCFILKMSSIKQQNIPSPRLIAIVITPKP